MTYPWAAGEVLTAADLNAYAGLVHIRTQSFGAGVAFVELTNVFSSTFDNYRVIIRYEQASTGGGLLLQLGTLTTGYYGSLFRDLYTGGLTGYVRTNNGSAFEIAQTDGSWRTSVSLDLISPFIATESTEINGLYFGRGYSGFFMGSSSVASHTGFRIQMPSPNTISTGVVRVYGYNNG